MDKVMAHASHLLTSFIQLRERYALLHPMLFVEHVPKQYGSAKQARGFAILKTSLFLSCCQDIAKLLTDTHDRTPSIKRIMDKLDDPTVRMRFRKRYCDARPMFAKVDDDPEVEEVCDRMEREYARKQGLDFDQTHHQAVRCWEALKVSPPFAGFRTIRDKVTAHTEVRLHQGVYKPVDIGELGIQWGDLKRTIEAMQEIVELIGRLTRDASFAWESLDRMLTDAGNDFWTKRSVGDGPTAPGASPAGERS